MKKSLQIYHKGEMPFSLQIGSDNPALKIDCISFNRNEIDTHEEDEEIYWNEFLNKYLFSSNYDLVLIDNSVKPHEALIIMCHIRLGNDNVKSKIQIIYYSEKAIDDILRIPGLEHKNILINGAIDFVWRYYYDNKEEVVKDILQIIKTGRTINSDSFLELKIYPNTKGSSHQITNEWGAVILAEVAELKEVANKIANSQSKSKTVYFKYLKLKHKLKFDSIQVSTSIASVPQNRFLFIDDNYDKGWQDVFKGILQQVDSNLDLEAYENLSDLEIKEKETEVFNTIIGQIRNNQYKGILLDLRLTNDDEHTEKLNTEISEFSGGRLLMKIKEEFPYLPVIITTASNKAWNMEQLIDAGADGYFIKQGSNDFLNIQMVKENYESFKKLIEEVQEKHNRLQPFWDYIQEIKRNNLIQEKTVSIPQPNGTNQTVTTKVEERIIERLEMFFGLLKRKFEDTKFNKAFHYSDYKLAFMTLWSCLNDIQYIYYNKSESWINSSNNTRFNIFIEEYLRNTLSIPSSTVLDYYLQRRNGTTNQFESCLNVDYSATSPFSLTQPPINKINYKNNIGEQIGFLILTFEKGNISDQTSGMNTPQKLCDNLVSLKNMRNELYLTHGDEELGSDFFFKKEAENQNISISECTQLFEIIYFLLKGKLIQF